MSDQPTPPLPGNIQEGTDVFISYSRKDTEFVRWLNERFQEAGRQPWIDWAGIQPSEEWWLAIERAIDAANTFVFVLSPDSAASDTCRKEIERAVSSGKRIVPVVCRDIEGGEVHPELAKRNYIFLRTDGEQEAGLRNLFAALDTDFDHVRAHTKFLIRAREWEARGKDAAYLLRGGLLAEAVVWLSQVGGKQPVPTELHSEHIAASKDQERAENDAKRRIIGRAFVKPARDAVEKGAHDHALRLAAAGAVLAGDLDRKLVPEWWELAARAMFLNRTTAVLSGHTGPLTVAAWSPDGARVVTASDDNTARIWEAASGELLATLEGHVSRVGSAAWSPDGSRVVTASGDKSARIWEAASGALMATLEGHRYGVFSATWSPDGTRVVTASGDNSARIWEAATGALLATLEGHVALLRSAAWSPDGTRVVTASDDYRARIWEVGSGALLATLEGHWNRVYSAAWSTDGTRVVTASADNTARIWDAHTGALWAALEGHGGGVMGAAWSPDGTRVVSASDDKTARIWDAGSGALLATLEGHGNWVRSAAWSPDGTRVVSASGDKTARIWDSGSGALLATLEGHGDWVGSAAWSPDGTRVVSTSADKSARIWEAASGVRLATLEGHGDQVNSVAWSPDGARVVSASWDKSARIWEAASGALLAILEGHGNCVTSAAWSPDGDRVVTASMDDSARIWDGARGALLASLEGHGSQVYSAAWSPDGTRVVTASGDQSARIWDAHTGALLTTLEGHGSVVISAAWSPDGTRVVSASWDNTARIWEAASGALLATLEGHGNCVNSVAWSPDGARVVTASTDKTAGIWEAASGALLATLEGHGSQVNSADWSPDGARVVTSSYDRSARIWDVSRIGIIIHHGPAICLAAAVARGIGHRTEAETSDLLMQDAPEDLFAAVMAQLGPERDAEVEEAAAALRAPLHPNCYLSPTQFAEKFGKRDSGSGNPESGVENRELEIGIRTTGSGQDDAEPSLERPLQLDRAEGGEEELDEPELVTFATETTEIIVAEAPLKGGDESRAVQGDGERNAVDGAPRSAGLRLPVVLFLLVLVANVSTMVTLVVTGNLEPGGIWEAIRRLLRME